jgi:hypothetical protein
MAAARFLLPQKVRVTSGDSERSKSGSNTFKMYIKIGPKGHSDLIIIDLRRV